MKISINIETDEIAPYYHRYPLQYNAQPAYIEINPKNRTVTADYDSVIGGAVPTDVYNDRILRVEIPATANGADLLRLLETESIQTLLVEICDGHEIEWDGSNHAGKLTDDAARALDELTLALQDVDRDQVWDFRDYIESDSCVTAETSDTQIEALAESFVDYAAMEGARFEESFQKIIEILTEERDELREKAGE